MMDALAQLFYLMISAFCVMAFFLLAIGYWRQPAKEQRLFRAFSLLCFASFACSLALAIPALATLPNLVLVRDLIASVLPPMMVHLALGSRRKALWAGILYAWALLPLAQERPDLKLAVIAAVGAIGLTVAKREGSAAGRHHRRWNLVLFLLLLFSALGSWLTGEPLFELLPDYLLLTFFAVWLYYRERLAFFDVFLRSGAYVLSGAVLISILMSASPSASPAAALLALWIIGPVVHGWVARWIDRWALQRRYAPVEAEREFAQTLQRASTEDDLSRCGEEALRQIFDCSATVDFDGVMASASPGDLVFAMSPRGYVALHARRSGIPFLSDERRLLETMGATLSLVVQNLRFRHRQQELADLAARAELRALRAQINPHFLFNALNAIAGWIPVRPGLADDTVAQLAEVFRYALNRSQQEWVRLSEELDFIRACLAVEKARFGDRLEVSMDSDPSWAMSVTIPAMLLQPIVENATRHGTSQVDGIGRLRLSLRQESDTVLVRVEDNGPGFPPGFDLQLASGDHHGLRNVRSRLQGYYGSRGGLQWENTPMGCRVTLHFPAEGRTA